MIPENLYEGCKIKVVNSQQWCWYENLIGHTFTVMKIREDWSDILVADEECQGNAIDFVDLEFIK